MTILLCVNSHVKRANAFLSLFFAIFDKYHEAVSSHLLVSASLKRSVEYAYAPVPAILTCRFVIAFHILLLFTFWSYVDTAAADLATDAFYLFFHPVSYTHLDVYKRQDYRQTLSGYTFAIVSHVFPLDFR